MNAATPKKMRYCVLSIGAIGDIFARAAPLRCAGTNMPSAVARTWGDGSAQPYSRGGTDGARLHTRRPARRRGCALGGTTSGSRRARLLAGIRLTVLPPAPLAVARRHRQLL